MFPHFPLSFFSNKIRDKITAIKESCLSFGFLKGAKGLEGGQGVQRDSNGLLNSYSLKILYLDAFLNFWDPGTFLYPADIRW